MLYLKATWQKEKARKTTQGFFAVSFLLLSAFCFSKIPAVSYMDQVIDRKNQLIVQKCTKPKRTKGFMMIEVQVLPTGEAKARLLATDLKEKAFVSCALSLLSRTKFKAFSPHTVSRIYRFFL